VVYTCHTDKSTIFVRDTFVRFHFSQEQIRSQLDPNQNLHASLKKFFLFIYHIHTTEETPYVIHAMPLRVSIVRSHHPSIQFTTFNSLDSPQAAVGSLEKSLFLDDKKEGTLWRHIS
jgi:hypothetical protein